MAKEKTQPAPIEPEAPVACFPVEEVECVVYTDRKGEPAASRDVTPDVPAEGVE